MKNNFDIKVVKNLLQDRKCATCKEDSTCKKKSKEEYNTCGEWENNVLLKYIDMIKAVQVNLKNTNSSTDKHIMDLLTTIINKKESEDEGHNSN